ncbi:hypothetical protein GLA29479_2550 [Lysobacter antibioticus]|nr:hypothetical protein GLA29479_2550 [Lysobacter antibioticus]
MPATSQITRSGEAKKFSPRFYDFTKPLVNYEAESDSLPRLRIFN